ncbi:MAG: hypothetical protein KA275_05715 [Chitinophagaceae bacterium]|nr:hypothetical protein [Chitinophagaceae bacterium]
MENNAPTKIGIIASMLIIGFQLTLMGLKQSNSPLIPLQFLISSLAIFVSIFISFNPKKNTIIDLFKFGLRTLSTIIFLMAIFTIIMNLCFGDFDATKMAYNIMLVLFSFGFSGILSTIISAFIIKNIKK